MKLVAPTKKPLELTAIHPNAGIEAKYRKALQVLISEMSRSVIYWTRAAWKKSPPVSSVAQDRESSIVDLRRTMIRMAKHWQGRFDSLSDSLAKVFVDGATQHTDAAFMAELSKAGFTVKFKMTEAVYEGYQAVYRENVGLIKSIGSDYLHAVEGDVWRAVSQGHDLQKLTDTLQHRYGVTHKRAAFIARDQSNKAKAVIEKARREELGITQAIWQHSGGGKEPRHSHLKAGREKLVFDVSKGAYIDGEYILPGEKINCRCTSRAVIPGFED